MCVSSARLWHYSIGTACKPANRWYHVRMPFCQTPRLGWLIRTLRTSTSFVCKHFRAAWPCARRSRRLHWTYVLHLCLSEVGSGNVAEPPSRRDGLPEDVPGVSGLVS